MEIDDLIVLLFAGGFGIVALFLSPLGDKIKDAGKRIKGLWTK